jgi:mRNA-degrading endonuclease RelE of RelBE toxin-antitoxin system
MELPDHVLVKAFKTILDLGENPRPLGKGRVLARLGRAGENGGYDKVEGRPGVFRVWIDRDYRILYEIEAAEDKLRVIAVGIKSKQTYK